MMYARLYYDNPDDYGQWYQQIIKQPGVVFATSHNIFQSVSAYADLAALPRKFQQKDPFLRIQQMSTRNFWSCIPNPNTGLYYAGEHWNLDDYGPMIRELAHSGTMAPDALATN